MTIRWHLDLIAVTLHLVMLGTAVIAATGDEGVASTTDARIDPVLRSRLFSEGLEGWNRIRTRRESLELIGRDTRKGGRAGGDSVYIFNAWRLKVKGDDIVVERTPVRDSDGDIQPLSVFGLNDRYAFVLVRPTVTRPWNVQNVNVFEEPFATSGSKLVAKEHAAISVFDYKAFLDINTALGLVPLPDLIRDPGFRLLGLEVVAESGRELVKMTFSYKAGPKEPDSDLLLPPTPMTGGWAILDPEHDWGVKSFEITLTQEGGIVELFAGTIDYVPKTENEAGVATIRGFSTRQFRGIEYEYTTTVDVLATKFRGIAHDEFMLSAYGMPEPGGAVGPSSNYRFLELNIIVVLLMVSAVIYKYRRRLFKNSDPT